jgi:predicted flap endonuclease-1-like 5' DNA nuclease
MKIIDIEGIGPAYADKLKQAGIPTVETLLKNGASIEGRQALAEKLGFSEHTILEWVNRADLYRIKGVGKQYSDLLEKAGVDTVVELGNRVPENLVKKLEEINTAQNLVNKLPAMKQVKSWIDQAKKLPRIVSY